MVNDNRFATRKLNIQIVEIRRKKVIPKFVKQISVKRYQKNIPNPHYNIRTEFRLDGFA